jgi:uncharacterized protein YutE (UPF0331/DUF86 family)
MTDEELIEKKLAFIETCIRELKELARPEQISNDVREERFVAHSLQLAIQAALDIASHIVSDDLLGEPGTNQELFKLLEKNGWLTAELTETMQKMAGFRNILVHGYQAVDNRILRDVVEHRLGYLLAFVAAIRTHLSAA